MKQINQRQAHDALELLQEFLDAANSHDGELFYPAKSWIDQASELLQEVSTRQRRQYKRHVYGRDGRDFRAGDWVYLDHAKLKVVEIRPNDGQFRTIGVTNWFDANKAVRVSPSACTPEELEEIGQLVLAVEEGYQRGAVQ